MDVPAATRTRTLCIHLSSRDASNQFVVDYDYLTQIFSASEIDALHGRLVKILKERGAEESGPACGQTSHPGRRRGRTCNL